MTTQCFFHHHSCKSIRCSIVWAIVSISFQPESNFDSFLDWLIDCGVELPNGRVKGSIEYYDWNVVVMWMKHLHIEQHISTPFSMCRYVDLAIGQNKQHVQSQATIFDAEHVSLCISID